MHVELQDTRLQSCALYWNEAIWNEDMKSPHLAAVLVAEGLLDQVHLYAQLDPSGQLQQPMLLALSLTGLLSHAAREVAAEAAAAGHAAGELAAAVAQAAAELQRVDDHPFSSLLEFASAAALWPMPARRLAAALLAWWRRPEVQPAAALEVAQVAAARSCAYLRCANLGGEGGPAAGQGTGSQRCRWVDDGMGEQCRYRCHSVPCMHVCTVAPIASCTLCHSLPSHAAPAERCGTAAPPAPTPTGGRGTAACARRWARRGRQRRSGGGRRRRLERRRRLRDRRPEKRNRDVEALCVCDV